MWPCLLGAGFATQVFVRMIFLVLWMMGNLERVNGVSMWMSRWMPMDLYDASLKMEGDANKQYELISDNQLWG